MASRPLTNEQHCTQWYHTYESTHRSKDWRNISTWVQLYLLSESRILTLPRVVQHVQDVQTMFAIGSDIVEVFKYVFLNALGFLLFLHWVWVKIWIGFPCVKTMWIGSTTSMLKCSKISFWSFNMPICFNPDCRWTSLVFLCVKFYGFPWKFPSRSRSIATMPEHLLRNSSDAPDWCRGTWRFGEMGCKNM